MQIEMNQEIKVRHYLSNDLKDIGKILAGLPSPTGRVWRMELVEKMMSDALGEQPDGVFVAEIDGKAVGFAIVMHREWLGIAYLDYIQVKVEWMDKGIGHELVSKCMNWAKGKDARIIYTETGKDNEGAIEFYQRHGFKMTGYIPDYYKKGLDAVILVRKLR